MPRAELFAARTVLTNVQGDVHCISDSQIVVVGVQRMLASPERLVPDGTSQDLWSRIYDAVLRCFARD